MTAERMPDRKRLLDTAAEYVLNQRNKSYGEPDEDFQRIARIASAMGFSKNGMELTGSDVALFMMALKVSRLTWSPTHEDSWIDIAGYAACGMETANLEEIRRTPEEEPPVKPEGGDREGPRRLGISSRAWSELKNLADRVINGESPEVLESEGFMIISSAEMDCNDSICTTPRRAADEHGDEVHNYQGSCKYRLRPRRK